MGFLIPIIVIAVLVVIFQKSGVSGNVSTAFLALIPALIAGGGSAGAAVGLTKSSAIGLPLGVFIAVFVFIKLFKFLTRNKRT